MFLDPGLIVCWTQIRPSEYQFQDHLSHPKKEKKKKKTKPKTQCEKERKEEEEDEEEEEEEEEDKCWREQKV